MKRVYKSLFKLSFITIITLLFAGCNDNMGEPDNSLTDVKGLTEPLDGKEVTLQPAASASEYFEWEHAVIQGGGPAIYQIAFDKADGDFSNPLYLVSSNNNGFTNSVALTHKQLNKIAGMAGINPSATGILKWTVFSSKGTNMLKAAAENRISITRLAGFPEEDIPIDLFVTGAASEGGSDLSKAHKMKAVSGGEFEVYTYLKADELYYFVDSKTGTPKSFSFTDGLVNSEGQSTVSSNGVYRITLDFNTGAATINEITRIGFFFSPDNKILFDLPYQGYGVFQATETVIFKQEGWGRDQRYKFRIFFKEIGSSDESEMEWGTLNQTDSSPDASSPESYYYLRLINPTQWDNKWKLKSEFDGNPAVYTIYLQADQPYTHSVEAP